ncbi:hypothetical protein LUZ60_012914 [Juncus effusus]|nr:hypothetical protein LUZ60_012914 [Juncus effusus]
MTGTACSSSSSRISRNWSDLSYDLLVSIFCRLSSVDLIVGVSSVCSSWRSAARNKHLWRVLDLSDWDSLAARVRVPVNFSQVFNCALRLVREYDERIEEVYFPPVADEHDLFLVSQRLPNLFYFNFPSSELPGLVTHYALRNFKSLKGIALDIYFFQAPELFSLSSILQFPNTSELKLFGNNRWGWGVQFSFHHANRICKIFPNLMKLEMPPRLIISPGAIMKLLNLLKQLEYLDISGCESRRFHEGLIKKCSSRLKVFIWRGMKT